MLPPLIHVANALFLVSYFVRDILWLRVFAIVASACLIISATVAEPITWAGVAWNGVFAALNVWQINRLLNERRPVALTEEQARLHTQTFRVLLPRTFLRLLGTGAFAEAAEGEELVAQGEALDRLLVVSTGEVSVRVDGKEVARLGPGQLIGEMSYVTGAKTTASVVALGPMRYVRWPRASLARLVEREGELRVALQMIIGKDLVAKVRAG